MRTSSGSKPPTKEPLGSSSLENWADSYDSTPGNFLGETTPPALATCRLLQAPRQSRTQLRLRGVLASVVASTSSHLLILGLVFVYTLLILWVLWASSAS